MNKPTRSAHSERGVALIVALISILVLSTLVAGTVFVTQTQVWTSYNYRLTTQGRYAAEAGIQQTMNWIANTYTAPTTFGSYDLTKYPVQATANNLPVILSGLSGTSSNYPTSSVQTAYNTALSSKSIPGITNATFSTTATLLRMTAASAVSWLPAGTTGSPQTWQITSVGNIVAVGNILGGSSVQLQAIYERSGTPIFNYGIETLGTGCSVIDMSSSGSRTDSFNSGQGTYAATHADTGGSIASNGNISMGGSSRIGGTISAPNTTIGACPGNGITNSSSATPTSNPPLYTGVSTLSTSLTTPNPNAPSPTPPTTNQSISGSCGVIAGCTQVGSTISLSPSSGYGNLSLSGGSIIHLTAGTYNMNSLTLRGNSQIVLDSTPVILNIAGGTGATTAVDLSGGSITNTSAIASNFTILYAGALPSVLAGGAANYAVLYAPNSNVTMTGGSDWYGAVVANNFVSAGGAIVHYDRALQNSMLMLGNFTPVNFTWNKF